MNFFSSKGIIRHIFVFCENIMNILCSKQPQWLISKVWSNSVVEREVNCWDMAEKMRQFKKYQSFYRPIKARHVRRKVDWWAVNSELLPIHNKIFLILPKWVKSPQFLTTFSWMQKSTIWLFRRTSGTVRPECEWTDWEKLMLVFGFSTKFKLNTNVNLCRTRLETLGN